SRDVAVLAPQPGVELTARLGVEGGRPHLVVDLPSDHVGIVTVSFRETHRDLPGEHAVAGAGKGELLAVAMLVALAVLGNTQGVRILAREPCGWRRGRRAYHHVNVMACGFRDRAIEPAKIVLALLRLHGAPGELAHAHDIEVRGLHQRKVLRPARRRP